MTENEARGYIKGKLDCMNECGVFNREDSENTDLCDNCHYCYSQGNFGQQKEAFSMAIKALEKQKDNGWIPCSKRLPKYDEEYFEKHNNNRQYIVMCKDSYAPTVAYFSKEKTWYYNDFVKFNDVIAWQPLPEPYKECEKE